MIRILLLFPLFVVWLAVSPAQAQTNGLDLLSYCKDALATRQGASYEVAFRGVSCNSYIAGFYDGMVTSMNADRDKDAHVCIPNEVSYDQLVNVYVRWGDTTPHRLHLRPPNALYEALAEAFPCHRQ